MKRITLLIILPIMLLASCESKFDKKMRQAVKSINANLPNQANDWMWKDSVSYNSKERILYHYFSFRVDESKKELFRRILMNDQLTKNLLMTEDVSIYLDNNISMGMISKFGDGEVISKIIISPEEMKRASTIGITHKELTEYIYANLSISTNAVCPYRIDDCTTITGADFNQANMELLLYWLVDDECMPYLDEPTIRDAMKDYIVELIRYNHRNILELEENMKLSTYKRSDFPVRVTLVCNSSNSIPIRESVLSTDVTIN